MAAKDASAAFPLSVGRVDGTPLAEPLEDDVTEPPELFWLDLPRLDFDLALAFPFPLPFPLPFPFPFPFSDPPESPS